jgi:ABC-type branched-subunit amino acid transport system ATPase component/ABC-type branched-subunit amino acid transport system permease subunit
MPRVQAPAQRRVLIALGVLVVFAVLRYALPQGMPVGVVVQGLVLGSLNALTALGLVLIYRASRVVNFAQAEIGGLAASVAVVLVAGEGWSYWLALPAGLVVAMLTGLLMDLTVVRRFANAPRLIFTVATIGAAQVLGAFELGLPSISPSLGPLSTFRTPFEVSFRIGPLVFNGNHVMALVAVPLVLLGLVTFLSKSDTGIAVRAAADSQERALLLGIPVRKLSRVTWVLAAALSGLGAVLSAPIVGPNVGVIAGPVVLLMPLAAAVVGRMESLPITFVAALGLGAFQQVVLWNYPRSSTVDVGLFALILAALLLQRRRYSRSDDAGLGGFVAVQEIRPLGRAVAALPEMRAAYGIGITVLVLVVGVWPLFLSAPNLTLFAYFAIFGVLGVSLVVLTGWAGQISLGQFAFAGVGASVTAYLLVQHNTDLFLALAAASAVTGALAVVIGLPALRIPGPFLAVTTLAFGVPVSTYLLNAGNFPQLTPSRLIRPVLLRRFDLDGRLTFYYFCLASLILVVWLASNFRRSRIGRVVLATRENERGATAYSINVVRSKLVAFAFSGGIAGFAGGLYVLALRGIPFSGFAPISSLQIFTMVVIGGVASIPGAIAGGIYVQACQYYLHGPLQLLATGAGLLVLLVIAPGGLGQIAYGLRDRLARFAAARRGLDPAVVLHTDDGGSAPAGAPDLLEAPVAATAPGLAPLVEVTSIDAGYGQIQVLFDVDVQIGDGEIVALLGTNGAGKSTVLRVISGVLRPSAGRVLFEGEDITGWSPVARVRAGLVTVPGGRGVFPSLTVADNLRLGGLLWKKDREFIERTEASIHELFPSLVNRMDAKASLLSGGEQQMLTIAMALLCRPRLLMIDELSLGLAPSVVADLLTAVRATNAAGTTVVVVEQSVNVATALAERAVFMEKGQVRFTGPTADLTERPDLLRSVFLRSDAPKSTRSRPTPGDGVRFEVRDLGRSFGGVRAVNGVSLTVAPGEILGIIGSNGAGKTTTFDLCSGFLAPSSGRIFLDGFDVTRDSAATRARRGLARTFQDARLFPALTVAETLSVALERHIVVRDPMASTLGLYAARDSERQLARTVDELLELMRLERYRDAFVSELSTGTRRVVELACALGHQPRVLLLDEPSSGIAQREAEALGELLLDIRERTGASLLLIEHDIPLISGVSDRLACMHLGEVIAEGRPQDVLRHPDVVSSYLGQDDTAINRSGGAAEADGEWLTTAEYARRHDLSVPHVRRLVRGGALSSQRGPQGYLIASSAQKENA